MVLFNDVVKVLDLPYDDRNGLAVVDLIDGGFVGAAFVHRNLFRCTVSSMAFSKNRRAAVMSRCAVRRKSYLADIVGLTGRPVSMSDVAAKIGYTKMPMGLDELAEAVDKHVAKHDKK